MCGKHFLVTFLVVAFGGATLGQDQTTAAPESDPENLKNSEFLKKFDEIGQEAICRYMGLSSPADLKLNISRFTTLQDVTKLTFINKGRNLKSHKLEFDEDLKWKREIVDIIFSIFINECPNAFVKHDYLRIMRELVMIYLNSVKQRTTQNTKLWSYIKGTLTNCESKRKNAYNFTSSGLLIRDLIVGQGSDSTPISNGEGDGGVIGKPEVQTLTVPLDTQIESAELSYTLHPVIDTLWKVFSHSWASCMPTVASRELWGSRYKQIFAEDFLAPLEQVWKKPGILPIYLGVIMGDFDVNRMEYNMPLCLQAAYETRSLSQFQLIRPITIGTANRLVSQFQNRKQ